MENYSDESRNIYYSLLMNEARPDLAENYYQELTAGGEGPIVPPEEQVEERPLIRDDGLRYLLLELHDG